MPAQADGVVAAFTVRLRLAFADCAVGLVESVTVTATSAVPAELAAGVPVIAPVELLIDKPLGNPVAVYVYGVVPPDAVMDAE